MTVKLVGRIAGVAIGMAAATACVGGSSSVSEKDKLALKQYVLDKAPDSIPQKVEANFDGKLMLLGAKLEPAGPVKAGQQVKLTMYWRSDKKLDAGWNLFTHVLDGSGERILNIDNVGPIREWKETRQALPPSAWEPGKIYVDEQTFTLPNNVKTAKVSIVTGVWREADRLKIVAGPKDGDNRALVATLETSAAAAPPPPPPRTPMIRVDKLAKGTKITVDGKLDEEAWKSAPATGPFVDVRTGQPNKEFPVNGSARLLWDEQGFYVGFEVRDAKLTGGFPKGAKDPHLWTKDTVELMVDPDGDGDNKDYYELQVGPQNLVFDSQFDDYNAPKQDPDGPFGHQEWSFGGKSAVTIDGTIDKDDDTDKGYVVELFVPWKSFTKAKKSPPAIGDVWRLNLYAMQGGGGVAWSAILGQGNFHKAARFGKVLWAEKGWPAAPAASASAAASGAPPPSGSVKIPVLGKGPTLPLAPAPPKP
ncbi:MAG: carbohydrate-binding family 9-like protein [Polyangiaceae bacterium]|nr:carbohydrate-binding family 9-like protein [Polyangiaceae bacterium]